MNTVERFFRRYIFSTIRIIVLFFAVNVLLAGAFFFIAYLNGVADSNFPIEDFSSHVIALNGKLTADIQALEILHHANAWAMILNDDSTVICEDGLPEELPRKYTATDIAMFSRWYLDDYPVNIWKRADGLLVIGFIPGSVFNHYISTNTAYIGPILYWDCISDQYFPDALLVCARCPSGRKINGTYLKRYSIAFTGKRVTFRRKGRISRNQCRAKSCRRISDEKGQHPCGMDTGNFP